MPRPWRRRLPESDHRDHYAELNVAPDADVATIRKSYRQLALQFHPDKVSASERDVATERLAQINTAWNVLSDEDRRRMYDMKRESAGESSSWSRRGLKGWARAARAVTLGAEARTFSWASGMDYVGRSNLGKLHTRLQRGQPALLFIHVGGSPRSARSASAVSTAQRVLQSAVFVAAIDAHAEPDVARQLSPASDELPVAVLVNAESGARVFSHPLNASELIDAAAAALPSLPNVCTANQWRGLLRTASRTVEAPERAIAVVVGKEARATARIGCAADARLLCAAVPHSRCDLPTEVLSCPGVALLRLSSITAASRAAIHAGHEQHGQSASLVPLRRCVVDAKDLPAALRGHSAHARHGFAVGGLAVALRTLVDAPPVRAASAIGWAMGNSPLVRPLVGASIQLLVQASAPLAFAAVLFVVHMLASSRGSGAQYDRWQHRGRGRRLRRSRWR
jgi:hypothetical protein